MKSRKQYRLEWLQKQISLKDRTEKMLLNLGIKSKTTDEQRSKIIDEIGSLKKVRE